MNQTRLKGMALLLCSLLLVGISLAILFKQSTEQEILQIQTDLLLEQMEKGETQWIPEINLNEIGNTLYGGEESVDIITLPYEETERNPIQKTPIQAPNTQGKVSITVLAPNGEAIDSAMFEVYRAADHTLVDTFQTDGAGNGESALLPCNNYYLKQKTGKTGYSMDQKEYAFGINPMNAARHFSITNEPIVASLRIIAIDESSGTRLQNAVFVLSGKSGEIATLTTDAHGEAIHQQLPFGDYTLKEKTAPTNYSLYSNALSFSVTEAGKDMEKTIPHSKGFSTLEILNLGENKTKLSGSTFEIFPKGSNEKVHTGTTNAEGKISLVLPLGHYEIKQTTAAKEYLLNETVAAAELRENGAVVLVEIENQKKPIVYGTLEITKIDEADSGKKLAGAVFLIIDQDTKENVSEIKTDSSGTVKATLPTGNYEISELTAPEGYALSTEKHSIQVEENQTTSLTFKNKALLKETGNLQIIKTDAEKRLLAGAVFEVLEEDKATVLYELTTGDSGLASASLSMGTYYVREVKAPDGYVLDKTEHKVTIQSSKTETLTVINEKEVLQNLQIIKSAAGSGKRLSGAVFTVFKAATHEKIGVLTTNENGLTSMTLDVGNYYLIETQAPTGYLPEKSKIPFGIQQKDKVVRVEVTNQENTTTPTTNSSTGGAIHIPKTGQQSSIALPLLIVSTVTSLVFAFFYGKKFIKDQR